MWRSRAEIVRRVIRWLPVAAIFALAPKCLLCLAAYAGAGAALGTAFDDREICGAPSGQTGNLIAWFAMLGLVVGLVCIRRIRRNHTNNKGLDFVKSRSFRTTACGRC
jgi:hypothetical protein